MVQEPTGVSSEIIRRYIFADGVWNEVGYEELQGILASLDRSMELFQILDHPDYAKLRDNLIKTARSREIALWENDWVVTLEKSE